MFVDEEYEDEFINAKSYFSTLHYDQKESLFNKLCDIFTKLLTERPSDVVGSFMKLCQVKLGTNDKEIIPGSQYSVSPSCEAVKSMRQLFKVEIQDSESKNINDLEVDLPNLMEECHNWEQAGVGINRDEYFILLVSMKILMENNTNICSIRLWGKIFGLIKNYYILECEVKDEDGEIEKENDEEEEEEDPNEVTFEMDKIPKPKYEKPVNVPKEEDGKGANKNVYFVCNELGHDWKRLPSVHPIHITSARKIKKFFTGNLDSKVDSTPPFPGTEAHYLRAQIARITAGTQISPVGGYIIDEDDDDSEDSPDNQQVVLNSEFEMPAARELQDISNWVHHVRYILPQGRTTWWSGSKVDETEETEEQEQTNEDPEVGPPLLTPLSEDAILNEVTPWITRLSSRFIPHHAFSSIHSCLWWGAHAYATSRSFENIYIGWGFKTTHNHFISGSLMPEFQDSEEIAEIDDPTPQQERAANEDFETIENPIETKENDETERMQDDDEEEEDDD